MPSNVGPLTMPNYEALAAQGIYPLANGGAGLRGAARRDLLHRPRRDLRHGQPPADPADPDRRTRTRTIRSARSASTRFPASTSTRSRSRSRSRELTGNPNAVLGHLRLDEPPEERPRGASDGTSSGSGDWVQVARHGESPRERAAHPARTAKDRWNATDPEDEAQFLDFYLNSSLATVLNLRYGTQFPTTGAHGPGRRAPPVQRRRDVREGRSLLRAPAARPRRSCRRRPAEPEAARRPRGRPGRLPERSAPERRRDRHRAPCGRRHSPIARRPDAFANFPRLGDGVNFNIGAESSFVTANGIYTVFPFLPTPHAGRSPRHLDCGEPVYPGVNPCRDTLDAAGRRGASPPAADWRQRARHHIRQCARESDLSARRRRARTRRRGASLAGLMSLAREPRHGPTTAPPTAPSPVYQRGLQRRPTDPVDRTTDSATPVRAEVPRHRRPRLADARRAGTP